MALLRSRALLGCLCLAGAEVPEVAVGDYYGSFASPSLENTTYGEVRRLLLEGRPFVVVDGARGLPMASWDCDFVKRQFPDSRIRQEGGKSDVNDIPMASDWANSVQPFGGAEKFPAGAPRNRPFYWDITKGFLDERHRKWGKKPKEVIQKIVESTAVPYWLPAQVSETMGLSSEMWFHPPGAGAPAHMDPHCQTTVSFCFSGRRKWRMMLPPAQPHHEGYFDGQIYGVHDAARRGEWQPTFEFEAPAGSAVVVFPGMVHETLSVGEECSSSISQTFEVPTAAAYYRAFWPRFALIHEDVGQCGGLVEGMVVLGSGVAVPAAEEAPARRAGAAFAASADTDGDGTVSADEMSAARRPAVGPSRTLEELVAFHDTDRDGVVTTREVEESWVMYATAAQRARARRPRGEL